MTTTNIESNIEQQQQQSIIDATNLESSIFWQRIIALDVKYNSSRYFCTYLKILYIKRRNQLFRELSKQPLNSFRKQYLRLRYKILSKFYQHQQQQQKKHARNNSDSSFLSFIYDDLRTYSDGDWKSNINTNNNTDTIKNNDDDDDDIKFHCSSMKKNINDNKNNIAFCENFSFTGVHHIFDQHKLAVNCVKFANKNKSLICFASDDNTLSICQLTPLPAIILFILIGHQSSVTSFEWSQSNDLIVSCSLDKTLNLWSTINGKCLRRFYDPQKSSILICTFLPINNNMIFTGNKMGIINILNLSTGIYSKNFINICDYDNNNNNNNNDNYIISMCFETKKQLLLCGDIKGFITTFRFEIETCKLLLLNKVIIVPGCSITSLSISTYYDDYNDNDDDNDNIFLLANCSCNAVVLFRLDYEQKLEYLKYFPIKHKNPGLKIKSSFCPNSNNRSTSKICIVTGSEDTGIYFYYYQLLFDSKTSTPTTSTSKSSSISKSISRCVNKLQGHSAPVLDVRFNFDESLLASADSKGSIIIWKRDSSVLKNF